MSIKRPPPEEDHPLRPLCDALRAKVDQADAKVPGGSAACCPPGGGCGDGGGVHRFDYMRAKDALRAIAADPRAFGLDPPADESEEDKALLVAALKKQQEQAKSGTVGEGEQKAVAGATAARAALANEALARLVRAGLLFRAERRFQKPKPGRKRRVKWPRTLVPMCGPSGQPGSRPPALMAAPLDALVGDAKISADADTFYVWAYDRPTSWLFYAGAGALLLGCAAVPLYPLAPHPVRVGVLYLLLGLLSAIVGTAAVRAAVFALVWILSGYSLWLLPNLLSEEVPIRQVLKPLVSLSRPPPAAGAKKAALRVGARVGAAAAVAAVAALLSRHGPSGGEIKKAAGEANDALLAYMETMAGGGARRLHNGTDDSAAAGNASGGAGGGGGVGAAGGKRPSGMTRPAPPPPPPPPPVPEEDDDGEEEEAKPDMEKMEAEEEEEGGAAEPKREL